MSIRARVAQYTSITCAPHKQKSVGVFVCFLFCFCFLFVFCCCCFVLFVFLCVFFGGGILAPRQLHRSLHDDPQTKENKKTTSSLASAKAFIMTPTWAYLISSHLSLNREGRWSTTDDFATSLLHFSLFSTAFWDLANPGLSIPWCCLPTSKCNSVNRAKECMSIDREVS